MYLIAYVEESEGCNCLVEVPVILRQTSAGEERGGEGMGGEGMGGRGGEGGEGMGGEGRGGEEGMPSHFS